MRLSLDQAVVTGIINFWIYSLLSPAKHATISLDADVVRFVWFITMKQIVIVGGGFGGVYTYLKLQRKYRNSGNVRVTLINKNNYFSFIPLLHEISMGGIERSNITYSIRNLVRGKCGSFRVGEVERIDLKKRNVHLKGDKPVPYDYLVVALGSTEQYHGIAGAEQFTHPLSVLRDAIDLRNHVIDTLEAADRETSVKRQKELLTFTIVGGGAIGVEIAPELDDLLLNWMKLYPCVARQKYTIQVLTPGNALIKNFGPYFSEQSLKEFQKRGIKVHFNTLATKVEKHKLHVKNTKTEKPKTYNCSTVIWAAGSKPVHVPMTPNILHERTGKIPVTPTLQTHEYPEVYAIGDNSLVDTQDERGYPMTAQVATQQACYVASNIIADIDGAKKKIFKYREKGLTTSLGRHRAIIKVGPIKWSGFGSWFIYRTIYFKKLVGTKNKIKTGVDWFLDLFLTRRNARF